MRKYFLPLAALLIAGSVCYLSAQGVSLMQNRLRQAQVGSTMVVQNTEHGVVIEIMASEGETVRLLHEFWAARAEQWNAVGKPKGPKKQKQLAEPQRRSKDEGRPEVKQGKK